MISIEYGVVILHERVSKDEEVLLTLLLDVKFVDCDAARASLFLLCIYVSRVPVVRLHDVVFAIDHEDKCTEIH